MDTPLVSIMIPVFNREEIVRRALDSAISQTYKNIEIIVCDNASTDNTWETLQEYVAKDNRIHAYRNETNVGPVRNWKRCLDHAKGKYAKFLWSDDEILPTFIEIMVDALESNGSCGFAYSNVDIVLNDSIVNSAYCFGETGMYDNDLFMSAIYYHDKPVPVSPGCALFRRIDLQNSLLINIPNKHNYDFSRYGAGNDLLMFLYCCEKYDSYYYENNTLSVFVGGSDSISIKDNIQFYYEYSKLHFLRNSKKYRRLFKQYVKSFIDKGCFSPKDMDINGFAFSLKMKRKVKKTFNKVLRCFGNV